MNINSHKLKILGTVELPEALKEAHNYHIAVEGEIRGSSTDTNDDGSFDLTYKFRMIKLELLKDKGEVIKSKDNRKMSQKLRGAIYFHQSANHPDENEDAFYQKSMGLIIRNIGRVLPYLLKEEE